MKYVIVSGSARPQSQALRIAQWCQRQFSEADEVVLIDLNEISVPWDTSALWNNESEDARAFASTRQHLEWCDALIVVSPEWHGMAPGKVIAFLQAAAEGLVVAHKPGLIIGESSTQGGAFPEAMIRGFSSKNSRINWIPEHLLVRFNETVFMDTPSSDDDLYIQKRARYCLDLLQRYTHVLAPARNELLNGIEAFKNGM